MSAMLLRHDRAQYLRGLAARPPDPALVETIAAYMRVEWNIGMFRGRIIAGDVLAIVDGRMRAGNIGPPDCCSLPS